MNMENQANSPTQQIQVRAGDLTMKEFVLRISHLIGILWSLRWPLILFTFFGGGLGFAYAHFFETEKYTSRLTFVVEEKSGGAGNLMGLASQFGFDLGSSGGSMFSSDNLMLLLNSRKILESALLQPLAAYNGEHLLNEYIKNQYKEELEAGKIGLMNVNKKRKDFTRAEDSTLAVVVLNVQKALKISKLDKKASIIDLVLVNENEAWSFHMSELIIEKAKDMYLELKTGKTVQTLALLESRVDSVKRELDMLMSSAANDADKNQGLVRMQARVPAAKKQMEIQLLTTMYGELVKNLELTRFTLDREEPVIQIIDAPSLPLKKSGKGRVLMAIAGAFVFFLLTASFLLVKRWWRMEM